MSMVGSENIFYLLSTPGKDSGADREFAGAKQAPSSNRSDAIVGRASVLGPLGFTFKSLIL